METLIYLMKEGGAIANAPVLFGVAAVSIGFLTYMAARWRYKGIIESRNAEISSQGERLKLQAEKNADLKAKVGTDIPAEIKARIEDLETQVIKLGPRMLREAVVGRLSESLKESPGVVVISQEVVASDARALCLQLSSAFTNAGWHVCTTTFLTLMSPSPSSGMAVIVENPLSLTPNQAVIANSLKRVGIAFDLQKGPGAVMGLPNQPPLPHNCKNALPDKIPGKGIPDAEIVIARYPV